MGIVKSVGEIWSLVENYIVPLLVDQLIAAYRFDAIIVDSLKKFFSLFLMLKKSVVTNSCTAVSVAGISENGMYLDLTDHLQLAFHKIYIMGREYYGDSFYDTRCSNPNSIWSTHMEGDNTSYLR